MKKQLEQAHRNGFKLGGLAVAESMMQTISANKDEVTVDDIKEAVESMITLLNAEQPEAPRIIVP